MNKLNFHPRNGQPRKPKFDQSEIDKPYYVYNYDTQNIEKWFDNEIEAENFAKSLPNAGVYTSEHKEKPINSSLDLRKISLPKNFKPILNSDLDLRNEQEEINPSDLFMVYLEHNIVDTINGFLAIRTIEGGKILLYSKEEALIKANKFLGEVKMFTFEFDKEKHVII